MGKEERYVRTKQRGVMLSRAQVRFIVDYLDAEDEEKNEVLSELLHEIWSAAREANVTITVLQSDEDEDGPEWDGKMVPHK